MRKNFIAASVAAAVTFSSILGGAYCTPVLAEDADINCTSYSGSNVGSQDYSRWASVVDSYLVRLDSGWMKVQGNISSMSGKVVVEYFSDNFELTDRKIISMKLPMFGGFYKASDGSYFIISGQSNKDESDSNPVYNIAKYDAEWNLVSNDSLLGANTLNPFDAGSLRCTDNGKYLIVRTCHTMYTSEDGLNHQANVTIELDMDTGKITDSFYKVANSSVGYASHSFNQFVLLNGNNIVAVDHGDAYPRSIALTKYNTDMSSGQFAPSWGNPCTVVNLMTFGGNIGDNTTGASVGGFEQSSTHYLIAGNTVDQSNYSGNHTRNIFVSAVPKDALSTDNAATYMLTSFAEGEKSASTPQLVDIGDDKFAVLWQYGSDVNYTFIDAKGKMTGNNIYTLEGRISDCKPVVSGGELTWYTWTDSTTTFYSIDINDPESYSKNDYVTGHDYEKQGDVDENGNVKLVCKKCGESKTMKVPTGFSVWWSRSIQDKSGSVSYSSTATPKLIDPSETFTMKMNPSSSETLDNTEFKVDVISGAEYVIPLAPNSTSTEQQFEFAKNTPDTTIELKVYPKYNEAAAKTFKIPVGHDYETIAIEEATAEHEGYVHSRCKICGTEIEGVIPKLNVLKGDVNGDTRIDAADASLVLVEYANLATGGALSLTDEQAEAADYNNDGLIDAKDASEILAYYAYLSTT